MSINRTYKYLALKQPILRNEQFTLNKNLMFIMYL